MTTSKTRDPLTGLELRTLTYDQRGLLPVVVQDRASGDVLMVAFANRDALARTRESGLAHFFSRSRQELWCKGENSGNELHVHSASTDCDRDTVLLQVDPTGPACHLGTRSCFEPSPGHLQLGWLAGIVAARRAEGERSSYTVRLLEQGLERIVQKVGEEAVETVVAALASERHGSEAVVSESADLLYHLVVLFEALDLDLLEVAEELRRRHHAGVSDDAGAGEDAS